MDLKKLFPILLFSVLITLFSCLDVGIFDTATVEDSGNLEKVVVDHVVDGDTLKVYFNSNYESIRIIGIDTPETHEGSKPVGEFGNEAANYLENFVSKYSIYIKKIGEDKYGRTLAYIFGKDEDGNMLFYEEEILKEGLARPLIYFENDDEELTPRLVKAYNYAFENKKGIFSKWNVAPVLTSPNNFESYIGKIVFLKGKVTNVFHSSSTYYIYSDWFIIKIREPEYYYFFKGYNLYDLKDNKTVKFYGELWKDKDSNKPMIMLRSPNEIVVD